MPTGSKAKHFSFPCQFMLAFRNETAWQFTCGGRSFVVTKIGKKYDMKWDQERNWTGDQRGVKAMKEFVPYSENSISNVRIYNEKQDNVK